jgi:hypothetical protein
MCSGEEDLFMFCVRIMSLRYIVIVIIKAVVIWFFVNVVFNGIIKSVSTIKSINQVKIIFALIVIISMI